MESFEGIIEFVAVAENRGFSAAARQLDCSTSHISRQIARLEERIGCNLVARTTRLVSLTESGAVYYQHCKELITGLHQANEEIGEQQIRLNGVLRVSAAGGFAEHHVAKALMAFAEKHSELTIDIDFNSRLVNFVEEGFDFAVRYGELSDSSLIARKLVDRPMMAVARQEYLDQNGTPTHPSQLEHHNCIISINDTWKFDHADGPQSVKVKGRWRSNNTNVVLQACEEGLGIAYLPRSTFSESLESQRLVPILEPYWGRGASSWVVYQNKRFLPLRARLAIDYLIHYFATWQD